MNNTRKLNFRIGFTIVLMSLALWVLLLFNPGQVMEVSHCQMTMAGPSEASLAMLLQMNPFSNMMLGWTLMVFAMMLPKLISPIQYIFSRSFKRQRLSSSLLFVIGYALVWVVIGVVMNTIILAANFYFPQSFGPAVLIGLVAIVWQFTPVKQRFLNRGHYHRPLAVFGLAARRDALTFGLEHGFWCFCSGWALMLFPMLMPAGHNAAMLAVTIIMVSEHMEHPRIPKWYFRLRLKLLRVLWAQTLLTLKTG